jgi:hypothetical protein
MEILEAVLTDFSRIGLQGHYVCFVHNAFAEALVNASEEARGPEKRRALKKGKKACRKALRESERSRRARPQAQRIQGTLRWLEGDGSGAERWWKKSLESARQLGAPYAMGQAHMEMGRRLNRRADLEEALSLFESMGARYDAARARDLLRREPAAAE